MVADDFLKKLRSAFFFAMYNEHYWNKKRVNADFYSKIADTVIVFSAAASAILGAYSLNIQNLTLFNSNAVIALITFLCVGIKQVFDWNQLVKFYGVTADKSTDIAAEVLLLAEKIIVSGKIHDSDFEVYLRLKSRLLYIPADSSKPLSETVCVEIKKKAEGNTNLHQWAL